MLVKLLPEKQPQPQNNASKGAMVRAFHRQHGKRDVATEMYQRIRSYFNEYYGSIAYSASYTCIIGPSGIGKSYMIQQLAYQNYCYVIYASLASSDSKSLPEALVHR